ncbi:MAG: UDP-N-acetylglucosamine 2-epimerase (non-hydrolyzing) [Candidatus Delongbacteria bacterium]|nr:UDP-N-acetylglucosamine 2-epimerase (non-hydrolyzing) [Candidatus Delongbacteria bacterium]
MKIATAIGARPQFIKAASVSRAVKNIHSEVEEIIIHTGQHYDYGMSEVFFKELEIPEPKYNLGISSLSHGAMLGRMIEKIEEVLLYETPDIVLIYGDTNSTLAGAVASVKLHIPVAHVEAGLRSFNNLMPEEINRILADRISSLLFVPTAGAIQNLLNEGFDNFDSKIINSGDVMFDSLLFNKNKMIKPDFEIPDKYILSTLHRPETTNSFENLNNCLEVFMNKSPIPVILILHPGTKEKILKYKITSESENLILIQPVSYYEMLYLLNNCALVATDSGGLQKEAFWFNKYCVTLRNESEWTELVENGFNSVCGYDILKIENSIIELLNKPKFDSKNYDFYGKGNASEIILKEIINFVNKNRTI